MNAPKLCISKSVLLLASRKLYATDRNSPPSSISNHLSTNRAPPRVEVFRVNWFAEAVPRTSEPSCETVVVCSALSSRVHPTVNEALFFGAMLFYYRHYLPLDSNVAS